MKAPQMPSWLTPVLGPTGIAVITFAYLAYLVADNRRRAAEHAERMRWLRLDLSSAGADDAEAALDPGDQHL